VCSLAYFTVGGRRPYLVCQGVKHFIDQVKSGKIIRPGTCPPGPRNTQGDDLMAVNIKDLEGWVDEALRDDRGFKTYDLDSEAQKAKEMIKTVIMKLRGRIF